MNRLILLTCCVVGGVTVVFAFWAFADDPGVVWQECFAFDPVFIVPDLRALLSVLRQQARCNSAAKGTQATLTVLDLDLSIDGEDLYDAK